MEMRGIKRALISVTHKDKLDDFVRFLADNNVEIVSTGGTLKFIEGLGVKVTAVSDVTGFPEILNGRVKTLHPYIHGGILADKDNKEHLDTLESHKIKPFDLVIVNLYDFKSALEKKLPVRQMVEEIDIGGPCLLRASSKNYHSMLVLSDFNDYAEAKKQMQANNMQVDLAFRKKMAAATFKRTSSYDAMITSYLSQD